MNKKTLQEIIAAGRRAKRIKGAQRRGKDSPLAALRKGVVGRGMDPRLGAGIVEPSDGAMVMGTRGLKGVAARAGAGAERGLEAAAGAMKVPGWAKAGLAVGGTLGLADLGLWATDAITGDGGYSEKDLRKMMIVQAHRERMMKRSQEPLVGAIEQNKRTMATMDPTLMASLLAGEPLNPGEKIMGGTPRTDILDQIAMAMAQGQFTPTDPYDALEI